MNNEKDMICITCPNGCRLHVEYDQSLIEAGQMDKDHIIVTGNTCKRGVDFAFTELTNPTRTISSTVRTTFEEYPVFPVRVSREIPKDMIFPVMEEINKVTLTEKVRIGDIIIENVLGTGADIIAIANM